MTVRQWIDGASEQLRLVSESPRLEAQQILGHALQVSRTWLFAHPEEPIGSEADPLLSRRLRHEPLAYILGSREFFGRDFAVGPGVLIPRQDTETVVEAALAVGDAAHPLRILDIGTGSGVLAITLKLERPQWEVTALDISPQALDIARANAEQLGAEISIIESDLFSAVPGRQFDLIVSNPPYIGREEPLSREVKDFEPDLALFAEEEGLAIYRRLSETAHLHLSSGGLVLLEVGYRQADAVAQLFARPEYNNPRRWKDLAGIDRVVGASRA